MPIFQVTTGIGKCVSGNPIRNNRGRILMGGNIAGQKFSVPTLEDNLNQVPFYASKLVASVSPDSSGNIGHGVALSTANFANFGTKKNPGFIIDKVTTVIGGASNTILQSAGSDVSGRRAIGRYYSSTRYNYTQFNVFPAGSGKYSHGSQWGTDILASGIDGTTGFYADKSVGSGPLGVPYKFTFMFGGPQASGKSFTKTNP
jgi:hypothetical protein